MKYNASCYWYCSVFQKADIAAAPIFITEFREKVVDFSEPFLDVQATLLLRKTPQGIPAPIQSVEDLLNQSEIKYGTLRTGLIVWSFRNTNDTVSRLLWRNIQRFGTAMLTESNEEGISRVRRDKYAYILPTTIGRYIANSHPCDLITVDTFLMDRGYGLAFDKGSPLSEPINQALRTLHRKGTIRDLYRKWWLERTDCGGIQSSRVYSISNGHVCCVPVYCFVYLTAVIFSGYATWNICGELRTKEWYGCVVYLGMTKYTVIVIYATRTTGNISGTPFANMD